MERRKFIAGAAITTAGIMMGTMPVVAGSPAALEDMSAPGAALARKKFRPAQKPGLGGVAIGNGFQVNPDVDCLQTMEAAWNDGIRLYDTSPWYGLGISERRMGMFLKDKPRTEYTLSTKVGRILDPKEDFQLPKGNWKGKLNFSYRYDYSAAGVRRSVEDSLQRLGVSSLDIVFIHDLSPDNEDMKDKWLTYFEEARKGAMPALTKMREEGLIKGWGLGVNTVEPMLKTLEVADPDIFLSACQYSLIKHDDDLHKVFPKVAARDVSIIVGAPFCSGLLAGKKRYLYKYDIPADVQKKYEQLQRVAGQHQVDLRTAALQFAAAPDVVSGVIPGAHTVQQVRENNASFKASIPAAFWEQLKKERLIEEAAPVPKA